MNEHLREIMVFISLISESILEFLLQFIVLKSSCAFSIIFIKFTIGYVFVQWTIALLIESFFLFELSSTVRFFFVFKLLVAVFILFLD